jgi:hypothetical protein
MAIQLSPEQELVVGQGIDAGLIRFPEDVIGLGIESIRQRLQMEPPVQAQATLSAEEWSRQLHAWIYSHPTDTPVLSDEAIDRESIYEGRGL